MDLHEILLGLAWAIAQTVAKPAHFCRGAKKILIIVHWLKWKDILILYYKTKINCSKTNPTTLHNNIKIKKETKMCSLSSPSFFLSLSLKY